MYVKVSSVCCLRILLFKDWYFGVRGTFSYAHNTLDQIFETDATYNNPNRRRTGRADGTMFGYKCLGYFTYDDFNPDGSLKSGIATQPWGQVYPGDLRYEDLSGPDGKIDENDMTVIGRSNWNPEVIFGLAPTVRWKGFDLDALFQGATRTNISLGETLVMPFFDSGSATKLQFKDHWTPIYTNITRSATTLRSSRGSEDTPWRRSLTPWGRTDGTSHFRRDGATRRSISRSRAATARCTCGSTARRLDTARGLQPMPAST